jgi:hypothetical protein
MPTEVRRRPFPTNRQELGNATNDVMDRFAAIQLCCYSASCICMILYACHYAAGYPITIRIHMHNACEIVLVVFRGLNEFLHGKLDRNDIIHHCVFIVGSWTVINVPDCAYFGFLLSHMQCQHFPVVLWYAGGRRSLAKPGNSIPQLIIAVIFPTLWLFCVSYRTTVMGFTLYSTLRHLRIVVSIPFFLMLRMTTHMDHSWTSHFFSQLGRPSNSAIAITMIAGSVVGCLVLFLPTQ